MGFDAGELDGFGDGVLQAYGFLVDDAEEFLTDLLGAGRDHDEAGDAGSDSGERGFEVVCNLTPSS